MLYDFHVHSNYSDSSRSLEEIIDLAVIKGVEGISFVDHDTTETYNNAIQIAKNKNIKIIPGIEISAYDFKRNKKVHILGYNYSKDGKNIKSICNPLLRRRKIRGLEQIGLLQSSGYNLSIDKVKASINEDRTIYKQQIMYALVEKPYNSKEYQDLYLSLFKGTGILVGDINYIDVYGAIDAIIKDGGIPVIAHPGETDSYDLIPELVEKGLKGIEVYHPAHNLDDIEKAKNLARKYKLLETGGSDDHGIYGKYFGFGTSKLPESTIKELIS